MANLKDLNKRIKSVGNTRKITKAMEMVAAAKLRKAQESIETLRPFGDGMVEMTAEVVRGIRSGAPLPLLEEREAKKVAIVMFTGDRGLAGALNANVVRRSRQLADEWQEQGAEVHWLGVGKKGVGTLQFLGEDVKQAWRGLTDAPTYLDAVSISHYVIREFEAKEFDKVIMVFNHFGSAMSQHVVVQDMLPLTEELIGMSVTEMATSQEAEAVEALQADKFAQTEGGYQPDWHFEPDNLTLLNRLLPTYAETAVYRALLESTASEHGARMTAMKSASDNAGDMIDSLTLQRNRARQAEITQEILEVVGGADAQS